MERKYSKENPMPRAEYNRLRRNARRRISTRKKNQTKPETIRQFEQVLFDVIKSKSENPPNLERLQKEIETRVREFVFAETGKVLPAGAKLKGLFAEYGLGKRELGNLTQKVIKNRRNLLKPAYKQGLDPIPHS